MMAEREALLANILQHPAEDLPRLVFADYLDESGHPADAARAQFIRWQIEAEQFPPDSDERERLLRQAEDLRGSFLDEWDVAIRDGVFAATWHDLLFWYSQLDCSRVQRRRGFVHEVETGLVELQSAGSLMFATAPIRSLVLVRDSLNGFRANITLNLRELPRFSRWNHLVDIDGFSNLEELHLGPSLTYDPLIGVDGDNDPRILDLFSNPHLKGLRFLSLGGSLMSDHWLIRMMRAWPHSRCFNTLQEFELYGNWLDDTFANILIAATWPEPPPRLRLQNHRFSTHGLQLLRQRFGERLILA